MFRRINLAVDGFLVGMLFEYTLRVEVSPFPIIIGIMIIIGIILDLWVYKIDERKNRLVSEINDNVDEIINDNKEIKELTTVPKRWMVYNAGQDPMHMLWYIQLVHFDDIANNVKKPRQVYAVECVSYEEALSDAISRIKVADMEKV